MRALRCYLQGCHLIRLISFEVTQLQHQQGRSLEFTLQHIVNPYLDMRYGPLGQNDTMINVWSYISKDIMANFNFSLSNYVACNHSPENWNKIRFLKLWVVRHFIPGKPSFPTPCQTHSYTKSAKKLYMKFLLSLLCEMMTYFTGNSISLGAQ